MIDSNTLEPNPLEKTSGTKQRIAQMTSNILNPFLLCLALILLFSFSSTSSISEAMKWVGISAAMSLLPVFLVIIYLLRNGKVDTFFINIREQRTRIYLLGSLCASVSCITLIFLKAPSILIAGFTTGVLIAFVFTLINLWWKISLHTAIVAGSATALVLLYGWIATAALALIPLTAWARIQLESHSLTQTVSGALLAALIVVGLFYPLALA
jgi:membrane-associated phospholipid phosphatase